VIALRDPAARRGPAPSELRRPQRPARQPERTGPPVAMAPPRSLPRMPAPPSGPTGSRAPRGRRDRTMRPMMALAVAVMAIVLGSGVSAALTGGRSVNPLDGIQRVVAELTHGRTQEQLAAYEDVKRHVEAAQKAADAREYDTARAELAKVSKPVLQRLTDGDQKWAQKRIADVQKALSR